MLQMYSSKGLQKNMLKACNFTENKLSHSCFDKLQKMFQTNILEKGTGQILLIVVLLVGLYLEYYLT